MHTKINNKIKVIFFDLGETIVELSTFPLCMCASLQNHLSSFSLDFNELAYQWGYVSHGLFMECREKEFVTARQLHFLGLHKVLKNHGIPITDTLARTIVEDAWQDFIKNNKLCPDALPVLHQLKQLGFKLGVITDCDSNVAKGVLRKHDLMDLFTVKVISEEMRIYKPHPRLFKEAIKLAQCTPEEGVYAGDSEIDIKGAKEIGLVTVIIGQSVIQNQELGVTADFKIARLSELPPLLSKKRLELPTIKK
ncbi:MAG: HAD family hydrolase [Thermoplasmata archaeon]|nr:HAD family hydrolase [Thermoplasmata archaeon]